MIEKLKFMPPRADLSEYGLKSTSMIKSVCKHVPSHKYQGCLNSQPLPAKFGTPGDKFIKLYLSSYSTFKSVKYLCD